MRNYIWIDLNGRDPTEPHLECRLRAHAASIIMRQGAVRT